MRKGQAESDVLELAKTAVLHARVTLAVMRQDGFTSAQIGSVDDDLDAFRRANQGFDDDLRRLANKIALLLQRPSGMHFQS